MINEKINNTYWAEICIGGDINLAKNICREYCNNIGLCVTIEQIDFIYSGGMESGVKIRLVNYPRFPSTNDEIISKTKALAELLIERLYQRTALLLMPEKTIWLYRDLAFE